MAAESLYTLYCFCSQKNTTLWNGYIYWQLSQIVFTHWKLFLFNLWFHTSLWDMDRQNKCSIIFTSAGSVSKFCRAFYVVTVLLFTVINFDIFFKVLHGNNLFLLNEEGLTGSWNLISSLRQPSRQCKYCKWTEPKTQWGWKFGRANLRILTSDANIGLRFDKDVKEILKNYNLNTAHLEFEVSTSIGHFFLHIFLDLSQLHRLTGTCEWSVYTSNKRAYCHCLSCRLWNCWQMTMIVRRI